MDVVQFSQLFCVCKNFQNENMRGAGSMNVPNATTPLTGQGAFVHCKSPDKANRGEFLKACLVWAGMSSFLLQQICPVILWPLPGRADVAPQRSDNGMLYALNGVAARSLEWRFYYYSSTEYVISPDNWGSTIKHPYIYLCKACSPLFPTCVHPNGHITFPPHVPGRQGQYLFKSLLIPSMTP